MSDPSSTEPGTTGHEWDGIQEWNKPIPRWWLWIFYATIVFAGVWVLLYPAIPGIRGATPGLLGYSSRANVRAEIAAVEAGREQAVKGMMDIPINDLPNHPQLMQAAVAGGQSAFKIYCVQCHGTGAAGSKGYPNLNDDDWLWGGDMESIHTTIQHGIRQPDDDDTRISAMPAFGRDGILKPAEVDAVVEYVVQISGQKANPALAAKGGVIFQQQCVACHGIDGKGLREFGAPNLTDGIWLYGGSRADIRHTVWNAHAGVMPAWKTHLSEETIRKLTAYVHSLGGGE
ncbi:cytochrome-c oxidase, cbb3-type subunit III [Sandaracinobacteroides hominis]|uniref:cytochrome-c oxidase, cbb3-type subunit III n=1 Tax=Sandaracinobacteroides hominis TaxID=2780086 RepID=UPI0018F40A7B|nr:cytochrome-c oxidase, cbb3-type subunit III [Sandaracinobacteroides hominis]